MVQGLIDDTRIVGAGAIAMKRLCDGGAGSVSRKELRLSASRGTREDCSRNSSMVAPRKR